jgi:hypothetical protein
MDAESLTIVKAVSSEISLNFTASILGQHTICLASSNRRVPYPREAFNSTPIDVRMMWRCEIVRSRGTTATGDGVRSAYPSNKFTIT